MHTKPDLRAFLKWLIAHSGRVITDVIPLNKMKNYKVQPVREIQKAHSDDMKWLGIPFATIILFCLMGMFIDIEYFGGAHVVWFFPPSIVIALILFAIGLTRQVLREEFFVCPKCNTRLHVIDVKNTSRTFPCSKCKIAWVTDLQDNYTGN